jgi:GH25 family lysozyme M1 (1,4-beta-N-acetylmuramidase)
MVLYVVDAHTTYQAGLDVRQVAREGYAALIVKATEGVTGFRAPAVFDGWHASARSAGMIPGAYHWLTGADGAQQADRFLTRIGGTPALRRGMLCAVDVEQNGANAPTLAGLRAFVGRWRGQTGGHPLMIYSGNWWWSVRGWSVAELTPYLWDSRYVTGAGYGSALYGKVPASWWIPRYGGWPRTTLLQFTSSARVAGKTVDVSAFDGDRSKLAALAGLTTEETIVDEQLLNGWGQPVRTDGQADNRGVGVWSADVAAYVWSGRGCYTAGEGDPAGPPAELYLDRLLKTEIRDRLAAVQGALSAAGGAPELAPVLDAVSQLSARLVAVESAVDRIEAALQRMGQALQA